MLCILASSNAISGWVSRALSGECCWALQTFWHLIYLSGLILFVSTKLIQLLWPFLLQAVSWVWEPPQHVQQGPAMQSSPWASLLAISTTPLTPLLSNCPSVNTFLASSFDVFSNFLLCLTTLYKACLKSLFSSLNFHFRLVLSRCIDFHVLLN